MDPFDRQLSLAAAQNRRFTQAALARFCGVNKKKIIRIEKNAIKKIRNAYAQTKKQDI